MSEKPEQNPSEENAVSEEAQNRREFLGGLGKWSSASVMAAVGSAAWLSSSSNASAGWLNRRGGWANRGGSWVNRSGGGGGWVNRRGGGGWINRR